MAGKIAQVTEDLAAPILRDLDLDLVDIDYVKEGQNWFLRVYIDSPNGVDLDTCTKVSEHLSQVLDDADPIKEPYFLEVSSPGAERPLKNINDFKNAIGKYINIHTYQKIDGDKEFEGHLVDVNQENVQIDLKNNNKTVDIPHDKIAKARLAIEF